MEQKKYKLEINITVPILRTITQKFNSLKSMRHRQKRNDLDHMLWCLGYKEFVYVNDHWERFTIIGKRTVTLSDLIRLADELQK